MALLALVIRRRREPILIDADSFHITLALDVTCFDILEDIILLTTDVVTLLTTFVAILIEAPIEGVVGVQILREEGMAGTLPNSQFLEPEGRVV